MTATARVACSTWAKGEPSKNIGGGTPQCVIELTVRHDIGRATARVIYADSAGAGLGLANHGDGRGPTAVRVGDRVTIEYIEGASTEELISRALGRYGWREVKPGESWWDGTAHISPVNAPDFGPGL